MQALMGATRYADFQARLPISHSVLSSRLQSLTRDGLLTKQIYGRTPARRVPHHTAQRSLWPVLVSIWDWERHWVPGHADDLPAMHHTTCGADFAPQLTCRSCGDAVSEKDVVAQWGRARIVGAVGTDGRNRRRSATDQRHAGQFPQTMSVLGNRWVRCFWSPPSSA